MNKIKLPLIFVLLSLAIMLAIYGTYNRYSDLKGTMGIQNSIFQVVELRSADAKWNFELNRIHSNNFPHYDLVNQAAKNYQAELQLFLQMSSNIQGPLQNIGVELNRLSKDKQRLMNDYLSDIAITRNSFKFLDTLLFSLHETYQDDDEFLKFLAYAQYQVSIYVALNQNIQLKQHKGYNSCGQCDMDQKKAFNKVNLHLGLLKDKVLLSNQAKDDFYNPEHTLLLTFLLDELSMAYVEAEAEHKTIQSQILIITTILVITVVTLLGFLYWIYRTIEGHRRAGITDPLTGLYNRKKLFENLQPLMDLHHKSGKNLALLFIDLDGFKLINDTHGHDIGDKLLQRISARFNQHVRKQDCIYRIGGDEFVILIKELEALDIAEAIAKEILTKCRKSYKLDDKLCDITLSIGISLFPDHTQTPKQLIRYADEAMYQAKSHGKNQVKTWSDS